MLISVLISFSVHLEFIFDQSKDPWLWNAIPRFAACPIVSAEVSTLQVTQLNTKQQTKISLMNNQRIEPLLPADLPITSQPQLVVLTFDDAVNERNAPLYAELFESGRKNPNGCPIAATFFVSHEWNDYRLVRNLYADGHEIASHSIS